MYSFKLVSIAILATAAFAQDTNLPSCAAACVGGNYNGCSTLNVACICGSSDWIKGLSCCVANTCNQADQDATIKYANKICAGVGITTLPQTATCASTASSSATAASAASASSSATTTSDLSSNTAISTTVGAAALVTTTTSASATEQTTGAAMINKVGSMGMGAVLAGIAVAL